MCRKCGERDRRGSAKRRRASRAKLLRVYGNGTVCPCVWCGVLVGNTAGYLAVPGGPFTKPRRLEVRRLERDRLMPAEGYAFWNLVPACGECNRARAYSEQAFDLEQCYFGASRRRDDEDLAA